MKRACWIYATLSLAGLLISCNSSDQNLPVPTIRVERHSLLAPTPPADAESPRVNVAMLAPSVAVSSKSKPSRMVIKTADLTLEVTNYDSTFAIVEKITLAHDGFVVASSIISRDAKHSSGKATVRIPVAKFDAMLEQLKQIASHVEGEDIRGNDVTEEFYDVSARLENKQKAEKRYQEILKVAKKAKEVLEIEEALSGVREEIEQLTAHKRYLADQADLSTINITIHEPYPILASGNQGFWSKVENGVRRGVEGFGDVVGGTTTLLIACSPILVLILALLAGIWKYHKVVAAREAKLSLSIPTK